jgi:uncharacterized RDD family membrane protein YckC
MSRNPFAPPSAPLEDPKPGRYELAGRGRRFANLLIDAAACSLLMILLAAFVAGVTDRDIDSLLDLNAAAQSAFTFSLGRYAFAVAAQLLYYISCESLTGRTLGKLITGTRTVTIAGQKPGFEQIVLRTLARCVPLEPLSFLGDQPVGWHDRWSGTRVVQVRPAVVAGR